jgi:hypothetical protein
MYRLSYKISIGRSTTVIRSCYKFQPNAMSDPHCPFEYHSQDSQPQIPEGYTGWPSFQASSVPWNNTSTLDGALGGPDPTQLYNLSGSAQTTRETVESHGTDGTGVNVGTTYSAPFKFPSCSERRVQSRYPQTSTVGSQDQVFTDNAVTSPRQAGPAFGPDYLLRSTSALTRDQRSVLTDPSAIDFSNDSASSGPSMRLPQLSHASLGSSSSRSWLSSSARGSSAGRSSSTKPHVPKPKLNFTKQGLTHVREKTHMEYFPTHDDYDLQDLYNYLSDEDLDILTRHYPSKPDGVLSRS